MNDSQIVALTHENEQLREEICQQQMQAGSNSVYLTRMQQKLTASQEKLMDSQSALIKAKWKNLLIQITDRQTRQAIRLGLTNEIRETNYSSKIRFKNLMPNSWHNSEKINNY